MSAGGLEPPTSCLKGTRSPFIVIAGSCYPLYLQLVTATYNIYFVTVGVNVGVNQNKKSSKKNQLFFFHFKTAKINYSLKNKRILLE